MRRREFLRWAAVCGGAAAIDYTLIPMNLSAAEIFPKYKIAWICHTQPGSGFDIVPRGMAPFFTKYLKELAPGCKGGEIIIKNIPAAAGLSAYTALYRAEPNGYTIGGFDISFVTDVLTGKVDFDVTNYTYLAKLQSTRKVLIAGKNGFKSWEEALRASKQAPLKIGVGQHGRTNHVAGILLKEALDLNARFIPAQSTAGNMSMLIRGDIHAAVASEDSVSNLLQSNEARVLISYSETTEYPGAVTLKALGHPEIIEYSSSHRFAVAPPKLPRNITKMFIDALKKMMTDKEFQNWAKKANFAFNPLYGEEALNMAKKYVKQSEEMLPIIKKYL